MKRLFVALALAFASFVASAQVADPCQFVGQEKQSVTINVSTATTTQLVALASGQSIYVCEFGLTISQVATTANTLKFVYGTGAACGTGTTDLTGAFGTGGITAAAPIFVMAPTSTTSFKTPAGTALCVTTTIGASASFQGWVTYVQR